MGGKEHTVRTQAQKLRHLKQYRQDVFDIRQTELGSQRKESFNFTDGEFDAVHNLLGSATNDKNDDAPNLVDSANEQDVDDRMIFYPTDDELDDAPNLLE